MYNKAETRGDNVLCEVGCTQCPPDPHQTTRLDIATEERLVSTTTGKGVQTVHGHYGGIRSPANCLLSLVTDGAWRSLEDRFVCVNGTVMSCRCAKAPAGMSPYAHLSDGCLDLICVKACSHAQYLQHLLRLTDPGKVMCVQRHRRALELALNGRVLPTVQDHFDFGFVEVHKVTEFKLECRDTASCWNIDGELLTTPNIHVKVDISPARTHPPSYPKAMRVTVCPGVP